MIKVTDEMLEAVFQYMEGEYEEDTLVKRILELHEANKPKPKAVGYAWIVGDQIQKLADTKLNNSFVPLYTTPPTREPLSEGEINNIVFSLSKGSTLFDFARLVERAHGIGTSHEPT